MKTDSQRAFSGTLNLNTPNDKAPTDALSMINFRLDQEAVLRGGDTFEVLCNVGAAIHSGIKLTNYSVLQPNMATPVMVMFNSNAADASGAFLLGAGTELYFYTPNQSFVGGATPVSIASGLSGNPLSIVLWNGYIWVLDSLKQFKINPLLLAYGFFSSAVTSWLPAAPTTALTATPDTTGDTGLLSGSYSYAVTFSLNYSTTDTSTGVTSNVSLESTPGPYSSSVTALDGAISIDSVPAFSATFGQVNIYRQGGAMSGPRRLPISIAYLSGDYVDRFSDAQLASEPAPPGSGAAGAPATPTAAPVISAGATGEATGGQYNYYVTNVNDAGLETNPGPSSTLSAPVDNGIVYLTDIPVSSDPSTVKRRIYRIGGTLGDAYQVAEIEDNTTTSYIDVMTDLQATELGIIMPTTNDPPPTGVATDNVGLVGIYFNTLLAWKNGKMYWSQDGIPLFPGSEDGNAEGNWVNVGDPDETIQNITLHPQTAGIYKARTIWRLQGDCATGTLSQTAATCGAASKTAVVPAGSYDVILNRDGVYLSTLDSVSPLSTRITPVFMGQQWVQFGASDIEQPNFWPGGVTARALLGFMNGTCFVGNCVGGSDGAQFLLRSSNSDTPEGTLTEESVLCCEFHSPLGYPITAILSWGSQFYWYAGDGNGNLLGAVQQAQSGQTLVWQSPFLDQGSGDTPKSYQELVLDLELNGATATVYIFYDNSAAAGAKATATNFTLSGTTRKKFYMPLAPNEADEDGTTGTDQYPHISVRIEIACTATGVSPAVHAMYIYYSDEERDAAIRGTDMLDFHSERITLCKKLEVDAVGQVDLYIWTDLPNGISQKMIYAGPVQNTRGIFEFTLDPNIRGRLWRIDVVPQNTTARVYAIRGWMREIGYAGAQWAWRDFLVGQSAETPDAE